MSLPIRTIPDDIDAVCRYLLTKPTGATLAEAKAVLDKKHLDSRKLAALKLWGLIEDHGEKMKLTEGGRMAAKDDGAHRSHALREVVRRIPPYRNVVERVIHRSETGLTATDVASHWYENFRDDVSDSEKTLNDQAVCFFQIAQAADLGQLTIGRKGRPTRFDFDFDAARRFGDGSTGAVGPEQATGDPEEGDEQQPTLGDEMGQGEPATPATSGNQVFISHGKNRKILEQVKTLVEFGRFDPVVAVERETSAKPVPKKVMDDMRKCRAAVIHVDVDGVLLDPEGNEVPQVNGNVLIEIGAAMALYGEKFILLVEEGVSLPSNLQGLYECRYKGDELNMTTTMRLLKAFKDF
ncbi:MAG: nucleotide-binding protein [Acidobacteriota bacterium]|nr:nucleotide-binding protein [Acidobacteriota bacterium]